MAQIRTFDHCGFLVEDISRAQKFYQDLLGAKPLRIANLSTHRAYQGWPIILFVEMGGHRFELCLAQHPLSPTEAHHPLPRIGFSVTEEVIEQLVQRAKAAGIACKESIAYPDPLPIKRTVRLHDPDGNILEFSTRKQ